MPGTNYTDMPPYHPIADLPNQTVRACIHGAIRGSTIIGGRHSDVASLDGDRRAVMARRSVPFQKL